MGVAGDDLAGRAEQIRVDLGGLREFAGAVQSHLDGSLRDEVRQAYLTYEQGVGFGAALAHSGDIQAARQQYRDCLVTMSDALADQLGEAEAMVAAASAVAARYRTADALAAASASDVDAAWTSAATAAQKQVERERAIEAHTAYQQRGGGSA
jgi:hypothetical protein